MHALLVSSLAVISVGTSFAQTPSEGPYHLLTVQKVGGEGGFDYVYADSSARKLYVARTSAPPRIDVFDLDSLTPVGAIAKTRAHGAASDAKSRHAFASSNPVQEWDSKSLELIKTIPVEGNPDGMLGDPSTHRIYIFSHSAPNVSVIDAKEGTIVGTVDLGGAPEQAVSDGRGHIFVDMEDKDTVAVIDDKTLKVTATYSLNGKGGTPAGLAIDARNHVLFVACRNPQTMVMLDSRDGKFLSALPLGRGTDGATFNPRTKEAFSSQGDGTLTIIKEDSPTNFSVEQTVKTMPGAKTLTLDAKTGKIFLIAAEYAALPAPAPGEPTPTRRGRGQMVPGSFSIIIVGK